MAAPAGPLTIHPINDPYTYVEDRTSLQGIHVSRVHPQEILWKGVGFIWEDTFGNLSCQYFSRQDQTDRVLVSDGEIPGHICIQEIVMPSEDGTPAKKWTMEVNTRLKVFEVSRSFFFAAASSEEFFQKTVSKTPLLIARPSVEKKPEDPTLAEVAAKLPTSNNNLSPEKQLLINQMVSGACLESEEHILQMEADPLYKEIFEEKMSRVHRFEDTRVRLYDFTKNKIAAATYVTNMETEAIALNGKLVAGYYEKNHAYIGCSFVRGSPGFASYLTVQDIPNSQSVVITKVEVPRFGKEAETKHRYVDLKDSAQIFYIASKNLN